MVLSCVLFVSCKSKEPVENESPPIELESEPIHIEEVEDFLSPSDISGDPAGSIVDTDSIDQEEIQHFFYASEISDTVKERIWNVSYKENDNIALADLRYLRMLHWGFDEKTHIGEMIVNESISDDILEIMFELYQNKYPIEKMVLVDEYDGDDELSMQDNNTSAFNYREKIGKNGLSKHSLGIAIDINPLYNPYVVVRSSGEISFAPSNSGEYVDRDADFSYKLDNSDLCVQLFKEHSFMWGGDWRHSKDYQHFEK